MSPLRWWEKRWAVITRDYDAKHRRPVTFPLNPSGSGAITTIQKKERA